MKCKNDEEIMAFAGGNEDRYWSYRIIYYKANGEEEISFYVYGATSIKFNMLSLFTPEFFSKAKIY